MYDQINKELTIDDFFHMMYLKPFECVLDENKFGLPKGLKIVDRVSENQYKLREIKEIYSFEKFMKLSV